MKLKLVLHIDTETLKAAKRYATLKDKTLSQLIEEFLKILTEEKKQKLSPKVAKLKGVIKLPDNFNYKKQLTIAINNKI